MPRDSYFPHPQAHSEAYANVCEAITLLGGAMRDSSVVTTISSLLTSLTSHPPLFPSSTDRLRVLRGVMKGLESSPAGLGDAVLEQTWPDIDRSLCAPSPTADPMDASLAMESTCGALLSVLPVLQNQLRFVPLVLSKLYPFLQQTDRRLEALGPSQGLWPPPVKVLSQALIAMLEADSPPAEQWAQLQCLFDMVLATARRGLEVQNPKTGATGSASSSPQYYEAVFFLLQKVRVRLTYLREFEGASESLLVCVADYVRCNRPQATVSPKAGQPARPWTATAAGEEWKWPP